jgi:putative selenate reductase FAD-binding subunit
MVEQFHRPATLREALRLKRLLKTKSAYLAGGTFVNSKDFSLRPAHLISLDGLASAEGLGRIEAKAGRVVVGALCTIQQLIESETVPAPLRAAAARVSSRNVRNAATLGGHLAANKSCSDLIPMLIALGAKVQVSGAGRAKIVAVDEHLGSSGDLLITRIIVPKLARGRTAAGRNLRASANALSVLNVAASFQLSKTGCVEAPVVVLAGRSYRALRLTAVELELEGKPLPPIDELQGRLLKRLGPLLKPGACRASCVCPCPKNDLGGSVEFKQYQAAALLAQTLVQVRDELVARSGGRS